MKTADDDLIDYEDDDIPSSLAAPAAVEPATEEGAAPAPTKSAKSAKSANTPATSSTLDEPVAGDKVPAAPPTTGGDAAATTSNNDATEPSKSSANLAPTNPQSEAEKRKQRALRFGPTTAETTTTEKPATEEATPSGDSTSSKDVAKTTGDEESKKKLLRAERFGLSNDQVTALDSALPDGPSRRGNKRGRGGEDENGGDARGGRADKKRSRGPQQQSRNGGNGGGRGDRRRGGQTRKEKMVSAPRNGDSVERKKMEERAKRFGG